MHVEAGVGPVGPRQLEPREHLLGGVKPGHLPGRLRRRERVGSRLHGLERLSEAVEALPRRPRTSADGELPGPATFRAGGHSIAELAPASFHFRYLR